tara:strand:+ start:833 stop:1276 length:444 start_codon:yes stop_codon:yes gene_type:complete
MRSSYLEQNSGAGGFLNPVEQIQADRTLDAVADSGKEFYLDSAAGAVAITLPTSLKAGTNYKFVVQEHTPTAAITIAAGSAILWGRILEGEVDTSDDADGSNVNGTGISNLIIGVNAVKGDYVELCCDGSGWYFKGVAALDGTWTNS